MLNWLKSLFAVPEPAGPSQTIREFTSSDPTITRDCIAVDHDGWCIDAKDRRTIRLFEVEDPGAEQCMITYLDKMKTENLQGRAYLEMWCRLPGRGEFFSKGFQHAVTGTADWASYEIPFYLKKRQRPDLIKLNVTVEGTGRIWIKDLKLLKTPLS